MYEKEAEGLANKIRGLLNFANTNDTALLVSLGRKEADLRESIKRSPGRPNFNHLGHFIVFFTFVANYREGLSISNHKYDKKNGERITQPNKAFLWVQKLVNEEFMFEKHQIKYGTVVDHFYKVDPEDREKIKNKVYAALEEQGLLHKS